MDVDAVSQLDAPVSIGHAVAWFVVDAPARLQLPRRELTTRVAALDTPVDVVVFAGDGDRSTAERMVTWLRDRGVGAVVRTAPATEAVKRVEDGLVAEAVDRTALVASRCPVVVRRGVLEAAIGPDAAEVVDPVALVVGSGATVGVFDANGE